MVWLRTCGLRSSVQISSAATAAFHIEYSHAKGWYCEASMVLVCRWNTIMEWWLTQSFLVYNVAEGIGMKESQFAFDGLGLLDPSHWQVFWCGGTCLLCVHFFKGENLLLLECQSRSWIMESCGYCPSICKPVISLRDAVTGPIISLTTNHVCSLPPLDFGYFYQMIWILELLLTVFVASVNSPSV